MLNPELNVGDRIVLWEMEDEISVPPGTKGTVTKVQTDPFDKESQIISVKWDNGSTLSLLSSVDKWKLVKPRITEDIDKKLDPHAHFVSQNRNLKKSFDLRYFLEYLKLLRETGITNMFGAAPFLYMDKGHLERYHGEDKEDDDNFQKLLEIQDETRDKFIQGLVKYAQATNVDLEDESRLNHLAGKLAIKVLEFYFLFF